jgi:hypothetical protein
MSLGVKSLTLSLWIIFPNAWLALSSLVYPLVRLLISNKGSSPILINSSLICSNV